MSSATLSVPIHNSFEEEVAAAAEAIVALARAGKIAGFAIVAVGPDGEPTSWVDVKHGLCGAMAKSAEDLKGRLEACARREMQ